MSRAGDFGTLTQEMAGAYESRVKVLGELVVDTHKMLDGFGKEDKERTNEVSKLLKDFDKTHAEMSAQLKADLAKVKPELAKDEAERVGTTRAEIKQRVDEASKMLKDFDKAHAEMSAQLKADLAKVKPELAKDEAERVNQAQIEIKERVGAVTELLDDFRKEKEEAATAWQNLVSTMEGVRGKKAPTPVAKEKVKKPVAEAKPVEEVTEEEAATPEAAEFQQRVFEYIADHPDGTRMVELERDFVTARIQMARILRKLMDGNKVEKRDLLYFAI